jgi:hypothetical protein
MRVPRFSRCLREVGLSVFIRHRHLRDPDVRFLSAAFELTLLVKAGLWSSMTGLYYKDESPGGVNESQSGFSTPQTTALAVICSGRNDRVGEM